MENHYTFEEFRFSSTGIFYAFLMLFSIVFFILLLFIAFIRQDRVGVKGFVQRTKSKIVGVIFSWQAGFYHSFQPMIYS